MAITIAVLGTGSIGTRHYNCLKTIPGVNPIAVPTRPERVDGLIADGFNAAPKIPDETVGVIIATNTDRHLSDWDSNKSRFCLVEKPLAGSITPELEALVAETQGRAFTACVLRFNRTLAEFKALIESNPGARQAMISCRSYLPEWRPNRDYRTLYSAQLGQGGALRELIHEIDYAGWIFGWPTVIKGIIPSEKTLEIADEERALALLVNDQVQVQVELDIASQDPCRRIMTTSQSGDLFCDITKNELLNSAATPPISRYPEDRDAMYKRQLKAFVRAIQGQDSSPLATAAEGLKALHIIEAVRSSSQTGNPVTL